MRNLKVLPFLLMSSSLLAACGNTVPSENPSKQDDSHPSEHGSICEEHDFQYLSTVEPKEWEQGYDIYKCSHCEETEMRNFTGLVGKIDYSKTYKILYIGNSYTFFNDSWNILKNIAEREDILVEVDNVTNGGWTLAQMADPNDSFGRLVKEKLETNKYDIVFIQEQSLRPSIQPVFFYDAVRKLHEMIEANGARDVLFETWGRKTGSPDLDTYGMTNYTMTQKLMAAYGAIGEELGIPVSHAGAAFYKSYSQHPEIELYVDDLYHPSEIGSYLHSLVHFATVFGLDPRGTVYSYFYNDPEKQAILENAAYEAVYGESILEDLYKTSSVGVSATIDPNDLHIELPQELPTETIETEYQINNGNYNVVDEGGKYVLKSTANKSTIMLKNELFKDGGEISFTLKCDGAFTGASEQGVILGAKDSNIIYTSEGDLYAILGRTKNSGVEHTIIKGSTILNDIANIKPDTIPTLEPNTEYRITVKFNPENNIYKMYVGTDLAMISYSPINLHGGYVGFSSGINGCIEVKDIVINNKYINVVAPQAISASFGYLSVVKLAAGDALNFNPLEGCYNEIELYRSSKKTVKQIWDLLNPTVSNFCPTYRILDELEFTDENGEWNKVSEHLDDVITSDIKFSIGRYRAIGVAGNNNCNLNGGASVGFTSDNRFFINAGDATRRWGAFASNLKTGTTFTAHEFNYVEDIEITRGSASANTQWAVQVWNPIAGQRVTYSWDGTVDGDGKAKVYFKLNNSGSFTPAETDSFFMIDTLNNGTTIKMRIAVYSNQMATEPYTSSKTGIITFDAYSYGAEMTDANKLHTQVVKNLAGFGSSPAYVNCCPEVTNAKMIIDVVKLETITE